MRRTENKTKREKKLRKEKSILKRSDVSGQPKTVGERIMTKHFKFVVKAKKTEPLEYFNK